MHPRKRCLVNQREVGTHTESFKTGLRAALREDPDIVMVGEMRDLETIAIALETAVTGHLVFGTLHTSSAVGTIDRIVDQFPADRQQQIRVMLADSLKCVISQVLLKRDRRRTHRRPGIPVHHPGHQQPDPGGQDLPDPQRHADRPRLWPEAHERRPGRTDPERQSGHQEAYLKCPDKESFMAALKRSGIDWDPRSNPNALTS